MTEALLVTTDLLIRYGAVEAVKRLSVEVGQGEVVAIVGANGAGKSSLLRAIAGLTPAAGGTIRLTGRDVTHLPAHARARLGLALVPEGRRVFGPLTVAENLATGGLWRSAADQRQERERIHGLFPILRQRASQPAATLSGGEQQMLAIGRALMARPRLLLMDEPSMGLAPRLVDQVYQVIGQLRAAGQTILLVEQNAAKAFGVAHRGYVLELGQLILAGSPAELAADPRVRQAYLGV